MLNKQRLPMPPKKPMKTGPANFLQEGNKKPYVGSPTNLLKDRKRGK